MHTRRVGFSGTFMGTVTSTFALVITACGSHGSTTAQPAIGQLATAARANASLAATAPSTPIVPIATTSTTPRPPVASDTTPRVLGAVDGRVRLQNVVVQGAATGAGRALVDGRFDSGITGEAGEYTIRLTLPTASIVTGLAVVGTGGTVQLLRDEPTVAGAGANPITQPLVLRESPNRWQRISVDPTPATTDLVLRWQGTSGDDRLAEVEVRTQGSASEHLSGVALRDEIAAGSTVGAVEFRAENQQAIVTPAARLRDDHNGTFSVNITEIAECRRAFLRYTLTGVRSWTSLIRRVNESVVASTSDVEPSSSPSVAVEEILPGSLHTGSNQVQFEPLRSAEVFEYRVDNLSVMCLGDLARAVDDAPLTAEQASRVHGLSDGLPSTTLSLGQRQPEVLQWNFGVPTQLHEAAIFVEQPFRGALNIVANGVEGESHLRVPLANLHVGWNRIAIADSLAESTSFAVSATGPRESGNGIAELVLNGSPAPTGESVSSIVLSAPMAGDCVGPNAYVRGFVQSGGLAVRTLQVLVGGVTQDFASERDGSFAVKIALRGTDPTQSLRVRALLDNGTELLREISVDRCAVPTAASQH